MRKNKVFVIISLILILVAGAGVTYSILLSNGDGNPIDKNIAKFIFNTETLDELSISLIDIKPGDNNEYLFSVSNGDSESISSVVVEYQMTLKTYHFIPLEIKLYQIVNEEDVLVFNCDETYTRNTENELVCNSEIEELGYSVEQSDNYKLVVSFPSDYDESIYSDLADFINIEITSWQKLGD